MQNSYDYLIGIDAGGSKTLIRIRHADGRALIDYSGAGAALRHGAATAWDTILKTINEAFASAGIDMPPLARLAVGIGIAGYNVAQWSADFHAQAPAFHTLRLAGDASTTLLGAHRGQPGAIIAIGTGTIGLAMHADGSEHVVDGWGFPSGDDGSGAWMGLRAINHVQHVLDGRRAPDAFSKAAVDFCARDLALNTGTPHEIVLNWLSQDDQAAFARVARLVVAHAGTDETARTIMLAAAAEIELMAHALDPEQRLPLALCGGLAAALQDHFSVSLRQRIVPPQADAADGALLLLQRTFLTE